MEPRFESNRASQGVLVVKNPRVNAGDIRDIGSIPGSGSSPGGGPGESQGQMSLVGYCPWDHEDSDTTKVT